MLVVRRSALRGAAMLGSSRGPNYGKNSVRLAHMVQASKSKAIGLAFNRQYSITTDGREIPEEVEKLSTRDYHLLSDEYLETLTDHLEELAEEFPNVDAELSQGVLELTLPNAGTYVINKQPPNKQIWISSPISGPDRFDLIDGKWLSFRTKNSLGDLLRSEISSALGSEIELEGLDK